jgi:hypothetical protein
MKVRPYCKVSFRESKLLYKVIHRDGMKVRLHSKGSCQDKDFVLRQVFVKVSYVIVKVTLF